MSEPILSVRGLKTHFRLRTGTLKAVDGLSFELQAGRVLCIVGESGSGKSVTAQSIMRLIELPGRIVDGDISFRDQDLLALTEHEMEGLRGNRIGMIFQGPMTSLNPVFTIGEQIVETIIAHTGASKEEARARAVELMRLVGIPEPEGRLADYPHQFSGGMRHDGGDFRERDFAGSLAWDPAPGPEIGPSASLRQTIGAAASGGADALFGRTHMAGLAANDDGLDRSDRRRLEARLGYGIAMFGDRFMGTPEIGFGLSRTSRDYRLGWRLGLANHHRVSLLLSLDAVRRVAANDDREPTHAVGLRTTARW